MNRWTWEMSKLPVKSVVQRGIYLLDCRQILLPLFYAITASILCLHIYSPNSRLRRQFPRPPGKQHLWGASSSHLRNWRLRRRFCLRKKNWGALSALKWFKNFRRAMRIPNMCLDLKLDNEISIANEQTDKPIQYGISI